MTNSPPRIDITFSITPSTHSFSSPLPPTLDLTLLSHASAPITLFTWNTPFHLPHCLTNTSLSIHNTKTSTPVPTTKLLIQRPALTRVRGSYDEVLFLTLLPGVPVTLSRPFGRNATMKPLPKHMIQRGWELDADGNERRIRRSTRATGVDGLEAGCSYSVGLNMDSLEQCKWAFATKDQVLVEKGDAGSHVGDFAWEMQVKNEWIVTEAVLDVTD
ncbi:hypothetical protein M436DRAFT_68227 [Aureobasidium namibiae CBS 147.97]|uniref:Uncharacterized protein n=1 Tax=Aureobasidium namibiae CBS 147.97 TaxID=1043004 RepID=A0A074W9R2_9PEZI